MKETIKITLQEGYGIAPKFIGQSGYKLSFFMPQGLQYPIRMEPSEHFSIPLGMEIEYPSGYAMLCQSEPGFFLSTGIQAHQFFKDSKNGELRVSLVNAGTRTAFLKEGEEIARAIFVPVLMKNNIALLF